MVAVSDRATAGHNRPHVCLEVVVLGAAVHIWSPKLGEGWPGIHCSTELICWSGSTLHLLHGWWSVAFTMWTIWGVGRRQQGAGGASCKLRPLVALSLARCWSTRWWDCAGLMGCALDRHKGRGEGRMQSLRVTWLPDDCAW